jgi:TonB family protein
MNTTIIARRQMSLQTGFSTGPGSSPSPRMILKPAPGAQGATARLALLPQTNVRFGAVGASMAVQAAILAIVIIIPLAFPERMIPKMIYNITPLATPVTEVPVAPPPPKAPAVRPKPVVVEPPPVEAVVTPPPVAPPKIIAPRLVAPKVEPKVAKLDAPKVDTTLPTPPSVDLKVNTDEPKRPRAPVQNVDVGTGSAAAATITKPMDPSKVQTGGFGDPHGVAGPANPNKGANVNGRGSFDLPPGPGYGNGTGGATGARGTIASTGFGNGTAIPPTSNGGSNHKVETGGFSAVVVEPEKKTQQTTQVAAVQPIVILEKPKPEYTAEARALKIEGDVVVQVVFKANGEIQLVGVAQGLGHGLDEMAEKAAQKIKYKPAISAGQPVDFPARVRIEFQLAY